MRATARDHSDIIGVLKRAEAAYALKKRTLARIRHAVRTGTPCRAVDGAAGPIDACGGGVREAVPDSERRERAEGLFAEADVILAVDRAIACLDRARFRLFLDEHVGSLRAREYLYSLICGEDESILELVKRQIGFLEAVIRSACPVEEGIRGGMPFGEKDGKGGCPDFTLLVELSDNFSRDILLFRAFMRDFRVMYRLGARVEIVGYGEISTVMRLTKATWHRGAHEHESDDDRWIWKKMPPFPSRDEVDRYERLYQEYRLILTERIGIRVPEQVLRWFRHEGYYIVYAGQERLDARHIGNTLVKRLDAENATAFLEKILDAIRRVHLFNSAGGGIAVGFDAQLSNWVLDSTTGTPERIGDSDGLWYIDTGSPLIRIDGKEQVNTEIFIQSAASFLRPVIRTFFLQEVLDRYYDMRSVIIDIIANLHKEKRQDLIDGFIKTANSFFIRTGITVRPISHEEIDRYYSGDAFIWRFYQASRKIDRFITEKIFRKHYMFRIPQTIER